MNTSSTSRTRQLGFAFLTSASKTARPIWFLTLGFLLKTLLQGDEWGAFSYQREGNGILIFSYNGNAGSVTVPETIDGMPVTHLDSDTFGFFHGGSVTNLHLPATLVSLGDQPLDNAESLQTITVSPGNPNYSSLDGVLFDKGQTSLLRYPQARAGNYTIPDSVRRVGEGAFSWCSHLASVEVPAGVTEVGARAFAYSKSLVSLKASERLLPMLLSVCIGSGRFDSATRLQFLVVNDSILVTGHDYWDESEFSTPSPSPVELVIPSRIDDLPVRWLGDSACSGMALSRVVVPASILRMGTAPFACRSLQNIEVLPDSLGYSSTDGVLFDHSQTALVQYPGRRIGAYSVPHSVTTIAAGAFSNCDGLSEVKIAVNVVSIGDSAFAYCDSLTQVTIPDNVVSIEDSAFAFCFNLSKVIVGKGVRRIGNRAFDVRDIYCRNDGCYFCNTCFYVGYAMDIFFLGDAPTAELPFGPRGSAITGWPREDLSEQPRIHRAPDTQGWEPLFGGIPTDLWRTIVVEVRGDTLQSDLFNLHVDGKNGQPVILEASQNLRDAQWIPVGTNSLTDDIVTFSDPDRGNHSSRFYRLRTP